MWFQQERLRYYPRPYQCIIYHYETIGRIALTDHPAGRSRHPDSRYPDSRHPVRRGCLT